MLIFAVVTKVRYFFGMINKTIIVAAPLEFGKRKLKGKILI
jgi:hypothetical protein